MGQEGGEKAEGCKVVLVTGWPKEETWDGEFGNAINVFNMNHYI